MAFAKGNKLGGRKPDSITFGVHLQRAIKQGDPEKLRNIAEKVLDLATEGERWAVEFLADRLDGKAKQHIEATVDAAVTFEHVVSKSDELRAKIRAKSA